MGRTKSYLRRRDGAFWYRVVPAVNLVLVVLCVWGNSQTNAGFCRPVVWATVVQAVSFLNIVSFTWLERTRLRGVNALLCGISTGVYAYWCFFLGGWVVLMSVPLWFLALLLWRNVMHPVERNIWVWYLAGVLGCVLFAAGSGWLYHASCKAYERGQVPDGNPMTERIAGMHFLYHTRLCIYDGWRPPLHDPAMVLGMRLNGGRDPLCGLDLEERVALYHRMYPDKPVVMPCACCLESQRNGYLDDPLWKTISFDKSKVTTSHEVWSSFSVEDNDQWMSQYGLPFRFVDSTFRQVVYCITGDTLCAGEEGGSFANVARIVFEGGDAYWLTSVDDNSGHHTEHLVLPGKDGETVYLVSCGFVPQDELYWISAARTNAGQSLEIFYPKLDQRDTLLLTAWPMSAPMDDNPAR